MLIINSSNWEMVPEAEPDTWDLQMIQESQNDPESREYVSSEEARRILGL